MNIPKINRLVAKFNDSVRVQDGDSDDFDYIFPPLIEINEGNWEDYYRLISKRYEAAEDLALWQFEIIESILDEARN